MQAFRGELAISSDDTFKQFRTMRDGLRAAFRIIRTYILHKACNTIAKIVARWSGEDAATIERYVSFVCSKTGIARSLPITFASKAILVAVVGAMVLFECGRAVSEELLSEAYDTV